MLATLGVRQPSSVPADGVHTRERVRRAKTAAIALLSAALILVSQLFVANLRLGGMRPLDLYDQSTPAFVSVYGFLPVYLAELRRLPGDK